MDIERILSELTTEEKINLLSGKGDWHINDCNGKVPSIMMTDGPHGLRKVVNEQEVGDLNKSFPATCFPTASAIASSWNPAISELMAKSIAKEAKKEKVSIVLGCGANMKRSPLCGRNFEYFAEDPYLAGKMGVGYVKGMQGEGVGTSVKHFACNNQETRRQSSNCQVDERALREIYLRQYEMIVKEAHPTTIMAAYNRINGEYGCANKHILKDILRDEWGFDGAVISDWGATMDVVKCLRSGMNLEMPDCHGYHSRKLAEAVASGEYTMEELDNAVREVLSKIAVLSEKVEDNVAVDFEEHHGIARRIENECAVLLKNDGLLPIEKHKKLIVIGHLAENMRYQGGGSSHINATKVPTAVKTLETEGYEVKYLQGYSTGALDTVPELHDEALDYVKKHKDDDNTVILMFIGLTDISESEGFDRKTLGIPIGQVKLLDDIADVTKLPIAAITFGGSAIDYAWEDRVGAILHMHLGGQAVADSIADIVSGVANPSGRLSETIPYAIDDTPARRYFALDQDDVEYRESIYIGYRYYETFGVPVRYPFGYGLSYTYFEYSDMQVSADRFSDGELTVSCKIKNIGQKLGAETLQLYVMPPKDNIIRAAKELKAFAKVELLPGEEKTVVFKLDSRAFAIFCTDTGKFEMITGEYGIGIGASVRDIRLEKKISIEGREYFRDERELFPSYFEKQVGGINIPEKEFEALYGKPLSRLRFRSKGEYDITCTFGDVSKASAYGKIVRKYVDKELYKMIAELPEEDPQRIMTIMGMEEGALESLISISGGQITANLVESLVDAANGHPIKGITKMLKKNK